MAKDAKTTEETKPTATTCKLVLRRGMKVDTSELEVGAPIAEVKLQPGVTIDFLGRAIFDGLVGEA